MILQSEGQFGLQKSTCERKESASIRHGFLQFIDLLEHLQEIKKRFHLDIFEIEICFWTATVQFEWDLDCFEIRNMPTCELVSTDLKKKMFYCLCQAFVSHHICFTLSPGLRIWSRRPSWTMTSWRTWSCLRSKRSWTACTLWSMERTAVSLRRAMWAHWSMSWKVKAHSRKTGEPLKKKHLITLKKIK